MEIKDFLGKAIFFSCSDVSVENGREEAIFVNIVGKWEGFESSLDSSVEVDCETTDYSMTCIYEKSILGILTKDKCQKNNYSKRQFSSSFQITFA